MIFAGIIFFLISVLAILKEESFTILVMLVTLQMADQLQNLPQDSKLIVVNLFSLCWQKLYPNT